MTQQQKQLFDPQPAPWELDDQQACRVATIVLPAPPFGPLDYRIPDPLFDSIEAGKRLRVPLGRGNRTVIGYCVATKERSDTPYRLKDVAKVVDTSPLLKPRMLRLTGWMADYYMCHWGQVLESVVPASVRGQAGTRQVRLLSVPVSVAARSTQLKLPKKQAEALRYLIASPSGMTSTDLADAIGTTTAPVNALIKKGLLRTELTRRQSYRYQRAEGERDSPRLLTAEQNQALSAILKPLRDRRHETVLIQGVTGSGKTEVYLQAIQEVIQYGRQAIVLVPEISLTPQTVQRFRSRLGNVAVLHSHLTPAERHWHWRSIADGEVRVIVGARSAVFAPAPDLGLIVMDEEHDHSFKQDSSPRYHARDVALQRADMESIPLVLGSATPSLESWNQVENGDYSLVRIRKRVENRRLPAVSTIDMRTEVMDRNHRGAVSRRLHQAIGQSLKSGGQVILLLNRRGYSTQIQCPACGEVVKCDSCDISLTHHRAEEKAICHYCDYQIDTPATCPNCSFDGIRYGGTGTQRLEAEVQARFPDDRCLRMDSDTMRRPGSHEAALAEFRNRNVKILLGTQMIAKGLDFPNVTLVGVINADTALHMPDFRAAERTFQLVTQVAGRSGRGEKGGQVLIQTFNPEHPAIQAAINHDFVQFANHEIAARREYGYPPFSKLVRIVVRGPVESRVQDFARTIAEAFRSKQSSPPDSIRILGPASAPLAKLHGKFRFHILLQGPDLDPLRQLVKEAQAIKNASDEIQWIADVDAIDML